MTKASKSNLQFVSLTAVQLDPPPNRSNSDIQYVPSYLTMNVYQDLQVLATNLERACKNQFLKMSICASITIAAGTTVLGFTGYLLFNKSLSIEWFHWLSITGFIFFATLLFFDTYSRWVKYSDCKECLYVFDRTHAELLDAASTSCTQTIEDWLIRSEKFGTTNILVRRLHAHEKPTLLLRIRKLKNREKKHRLYHEIDRLSQMAESRLDHCFDNEPLVKQRKSYKIALLHVSEKHAFIKERRQSISDKWQKQYEGFSWWNKLNHSSNPDFTELDELVGNLEFLKKQLSAGCQIDISPLQEYYNEMRNSSNERLAELRLNARYLLKTSSSEDNITGSLVRKSLWFSAMSVPVSAWLDVDQTLDVYEVLRQVNQNYADLSASEIFIQTLFLSSESLEGLSSLVKGAYFERLVAADTGGVLHEHFNTPDTDIIIDDAFFQLKATGSVSYVESVDADIQVIATSEVAGLTNAIDSGYSDEDLSHTVDLAVGGPVVDIGDTAIDSLLSGLGGLGIFATLDGINHACAKYEDSGEAVESMLEGAGVAIKGTARTVVGVAEMGYNVMKSKPSQFIGRSLVKVAVKIDKKISNVK